MPKELARTLAECETVIERGAGAFREVGAALLEIRDGRLYKATHGTFDDYCKERWGWGRSYAYRLIDGAAVTAGGQVSPMGDKVSSNGESSPATENERQARALKAVPEESRAAVLASVAKKGPVTAKAILAAAEEIVDPPEPLVEAQAQFDGVLNGMMQAEKAAKGLGATPFGRNINPTAMHRDYQNWREHVTCARPVECPRCKGRGKGRDGKKCRDCGGDGWVAAGSASVIEGNMRGEKRL